MNLFKLFKLSNKALTKEPESILAFQFGIMLDEDPSVLNTNSKFKGPFFKALIFIFNLFKRLDLFHWGMKYKETNVLFYVGTQNQLSSVSSTIESMKSKQIPCFVLAQNSISKEKNTDGKIKLSLKVFLVGLVLFFKNVIPLYLKLKKDGNSSGIKHGFHVFCYTYIYLPYFLNLISKYDETLKLVVMANDHNVDNRCLRLICELVGVKTLYIQHASVSNIFPPLMFDYALLDGEVAMLNYESCINNIKLEKKYDTNVFFTGQKKILPAVASFHYNTNTIGIAVNSLDKYEEVECLSDKIVKCGYNVVIRTHPRQNKEFQNKLIKYITKTKHVSWSDAKKKDISSFFSSVTAVIAANSSIHLEAALAGLATFYMEFGDSIFDDYYGFIDRGVTLKLDCKNIKDSISFGLNYIGSNQHELGVKMYSETYGTVWFRKEGELTATIIESIIKSKSLDRYFSPDKNCNKAFRLVRNT